MFRSSVTHISERQIHKTLLLTDQALRGTSAKNWGRTGDGGTSNPGVSKCGCETGQRGFAMPGDDWLMLGRGVESTIN